MKLPNDIEPGQTLTGALFNEPMRVETATANGANSWSLGLVEQQSGRFSRVTLNSEELSTLQATITAPSYDGDGGLLRLGLQAYSLGIAYEFDPYFALSLSRVDPLPHQLEAVYDHLLKLPSVRFLLADDAGAGKTIMAGLLIRELKLRGLTERIAVVCPTNLAFQWQRELQDKFGETFFVLKGSDIRNQVGANWWQERNQIITSLDLAKRNDVLPGLQQVRWDLVIVDEAHRMSARDESHKSQRYQLGEILRDSADHILLLTATPHKGDPDNFTLFLQLLDQDPYADVKSIGKAMQERRAPFYLRRTKEAMVYFPERQPNGEWAAAPVFTKRITHTAGFEIQGDELELYEAISRLVKQQSARASAQGDPARARAVGFLMALYQRRLASSAKAIRRSLENRAQRLNNNLLNAQTLAATAPPALPDLEDFEEMEDADRILLEDLLDAVFNVVGEILPATEVERVFRDYYAGKLEHMALEDRLLRNIDESRFREICQTALEGLATNQINLDMLVERRARARERRVVPETIARFIADSGSHAGLSLNHVRNLPHTFDAGRTPPAVRRHAPKPSDIASSYGRIYTDRDTAQKNDGVEWITPGHPLFEALRRHSVEMGQQHLASRACFHSLQHRQPARLDFYRARVVDGLGKTVHERLFVTELTYGSDPHLSGLDLLGNLTPTALPAILPTAAELPEACEWLHEQALRPFLEETRAERAAEVDRIAAHVELSLTELMQRADLEVGRASEAVEQGVTGAEGRLVQVENRHDELLARRERRRAELNRQGSVSLQDVERITTVLVLPHPEQETPEINNLPPTTKPKLPPCGWRWNTKQPAAV